MNKLFITLILCVIIIFFLFYFSIDSNSGEAIYINNTNIVFDYACNFNSTIEYEPYYNVSEYERTLLMRLLYCEACSCKSYEDVKEQRAIISVVFNRLNIKKLNGEPKYGWSIYDIVYYKYSDNTYAFTPAGNGGLQKAYEKSKSYQEELYEQIDYIIKYGPTIPDNVIYFCSNESYKNNTYFRDNHTIYAIYDDTIFLY